MIINDKKVALVTGASRGIGSAIAKRLAGDGMFVVVNYNGSESAACSVVDTIRAAGGEAVMMQCDVSDFKAVGEMITAIIKQHGRLDVLVNNAGITRDNIVMRMKEDEFDKVVDINLKSAFNTIHFAARYMLKQRSGRIINISSYVGRSGNSGQANYGAAKAGLIGLTMSVARELGSRHVTVNAIAPGFIKTDMTAGLEDGLLEQFVAHIPLGYAGEPEDVAAAAAFLASEDARYITGQVLSVDGGMYIG